MRRCENLRRKHLELLAGDEEKTDSLDEGLDSEQSFALESQLRDYLANNLTVLEPGLRLCEVNGRTGIEYPVEGGRIDVLAVDSSGRHVVIELDG